jgi:hypothetical protein
MALHAVFRLASHALTTAALVAAACAGGCCGPVIVSQRFQGHDCTPGGALLCRDCEATAADAESDASVQDCPASMRRGWLTGLRFHAAGWKHNVSQWLQPGPAVPVKPPHSRFHPVPTQPVFEPRPEYGSPEPLGLQRPETHEHSLLGNSRLPAPLEHAAQPTPALLPSPAQPAAPAESNPLR